MCGIYCVFSSNTIDNINYKLSKGMKLIQHRGQDSFGIGYYHEFLQSFNIAKTHGKLQPFNNFNSNCGIGHLKYATSGKSIENNIVDLSEIQPLRATYKGVEFLFCHNGNIPKVNVFDSKYILNNILMYEGTLEASLINLVRTVTAAYSLVILFKDRVYIVRDRYGIRPLCYAKNEEEYHISSETCAFEDEFELIKDLEPGQILRIDKNGLKEVYRDYNSRLSLCTFELLYFSNENSIIDGYNVKNIRSKLSKLIAKKDLDTFFNKDYCVIGIPLTGILLGKVYAEYLSLDYKQYITKNNNSDRTFIEPTQETRVKACKNKFSFDLEIKNKKIILLDDTIVRGNVIKTIIQKLRELEVKEVHVRIPSSPVIDKCYLGISIKSKKELISYNKNIEDIKNEINADSLKYLTLEEMKRFMPENSYNHCFSGSIEPELMR